MKKIFFFILLTSFKTFAQNEKNLNTAIRNKVLFKKNQPTVVYTKTLAIGPNPASTGEPLSVYLGDLPESGATLFFYDQQGKILQQFSFSQGQSMYLLPLELAAGVYHLVLRSGEKILDKERLVVR